MGIAILILKEARENVIVVVVLLLVLLLLLLLETLLAIFVVDLTLLRVLENFIGGDNFLKLSLRLARWRRRCTCSMFCLFLSG